MKNSVIDQHKPQEESSSILHKSSSSKSIEQPTADGTIFNINNNKVTFTEELDSLNFSDGTIVMKPHRCNCRFCPECGKRLGYELRNNLLETIGKNTSLGMLTTTIDRNGTNTGKGFKSPLEDHSYVTDNKYIPQLMRALKIKKWQWVLEVQSETGEGWPHWHILVDLSHFGGYLPKKLLTRARALWKDKWKIGELHFSKNFNDAHHAINYVTKHLVHYPEHGWPQWVLRHTKLRMTDGSRQKGPCSGKEGSKTKYT